MRKALRSAAWAGLAALLLGAAGALALKLYFTPERLKALVSDYAARNLRREISYDSVRLGLSGIAIAGLRVSEYPGFGKGEFLSAAAFSARPSFRSLLRGKLKVDSISASGLRMRVVEVRPETYNFSDLLPAENGPRPKKQKPKEPPAPKLSISQLKVRDSAFVYAGADGDTQVMLSGISLSASGLSPSGFFPVEAAFTVGVRSPYFTGEIPASLSGRLSLGGFDPEKGGAQIDRAALTLGRVKAELSGSLSNLAAPDARLALKVREFSTADLRQVFPSLPPKILLPEIEADADFKLTTRDINVRSADLRAGPLRAAVKGRAAWEPRVTYAFSAEVKAQVPEIDTTLLARKARDYPVPRGLKLPLAEVSASLRLRPGHADVPAFSVRSAPFDASGRVFADLSGRAPSVSGRLKADIKSLSRTAEIAPGRLGSFALSGAAEAAVDFSYSGTPEARGSLTLKNAGATFAGKTISGLSGTLEFTRDSASTKKISGRLDGGDFTASFRAADLAKRPKINLDAELARLTLKDTPPAEKSAGKGSPAKPAGTPAYMDVSGSVVIGAIEHANFRCGRAEARFSLSDVSDDLKALGGSASFSAGPGKFSGLYALAADHKAAKVALFPLLAMQKASKLAKGLNLPDFDNVDFDTMEGDYSFARGQMKINKSALNAPVADMTSSGSIDLPEERLDLRIRTRLKKGSGVSMSEPLGLIVKGTMSDPSVKPDLASLAEQPAVKKAAEKLAPAAEKLLKGLFKK